MRLPTLPPFGSLAQLVKSTALSPGSNCGQRCAGGSSDLSDLDLNKGSGFPPDAETLIKVVEGKLSGEKTILPSSVQSPPRPLGASQSVMALPPLTEIFFNFPRTKKPIHSPSRDKKGLNAPSVPGKGTA